MNQINKSLAVGVVLLAVVIPLTTWLAVRNQENRSNAASDTTTVVSETEEVDVDGVCGDMNGGTVSEMPDNRYACAKGAVNWIDSVATDGSYNWICIGTKDGVMESCEAFLEN